MRATALLVTCALLAHSALADETPGLTLVGPDGGSHAEPLGALRALPQHDVPIRFQTGHGPEGATYHGALLWDALTSAGLIAGATARKDAPRWLRVTGRDGYAVVLSLGEIDPELEGKPVLLAWSADGASLRPGEVRLAVPGDKHGARSVRDVARIEVR